MFCRWFYHPNNAYVSILATLLLNTHCVQYLGYNPNRVSFKAMGWLRSHNTPSKSSMWIFMYIPCAFGTLWTLKVVCGNTVSCTCLQVMVKYLEFEVILPNNHTWTAGHARELKLWRVPKKNHKRLIVFSYLFHHICKEKDETHFIIHQHAFLWIKIYVRHLKYCRATFW